jgi:hypothetical protein
MLWRGCSGEDALERMRTRRTCILILCALEAAESVEVLKLE